MVDVDLDKIFCTNAKTYRIPKLLLKAIGITESSLQVEAYRYEPGLAAYLLKKPEWANRDMNEVAASYGIMQVLYTTAVGLGFPADSPGIELYNPVYNIMLGAKLCRQLMDGIEKSNLHIKHRTWPIVIMLARYNGGFSGNPSEDGTIRNSSYVNKVMNTWFELRKQEDDSCYE